MKGKTLIAIAFASFLLSGSVQWELIKNATYKGADLYYLLDEKATEFRESGAAFNNFHQLIKVLTWKGAKELSVLIFPYDPANTGVKVKKVRIWRKEGVIEEVPLDKLKDEPAPAGRIFWGHRFKALQLPPLRPGDAVELSYRTWGYQIAYLSEEKEIVPPLYGHFYDIVYFYSRYPVAKKVYRLFGPKKVLLSYEVFNGSLKVSKYFKGEKVYYVWEKKNIKPYRRERYMPSLSDVELKLIVSSLHDWRVKSRWFFNVVEPILKPTPSLRKKVRELTAGARTPEDKIFSLTHWVAQEVRYLGLSLGPAEGYTPHPASYTLKILAGVCKDKAALLTAMLRIAGFAAFPVMTMAGARVERVVADQFNHSVTAIRIKPHKFRLLDPTWAPNSRELWSTREQLQYYLVGTPEGEDLMQTPPVAPELNYLRIKLTGRMKNMDFDGVIRLSADNHYDTYLRRSMNSSPRLKRNGIFYELLYDLSPHAQIKSIKFSDPYDFRRPMFAKIRFRIRNYALRYGNKLVVFPLLARMPLRRFHEFLNIEVKNRKYPVKLRNTRLLNFIEEVEIPKGYKLTAMLDEIKEDNPEASVQVKFDFRNRRLRIWYKIKFKRVLVKPESFKNFGKVISAIKKLQKSYILFEKAGG